MTHGAHPPAAPKPGNLQRRHVGVLLPLGGLALLATGSKPQETAAPATPPVAAAAPPAASASQVVAARNPKHQAGQACAKKAG